MTVEESRSLYSMNRKTGKFSETDILLWFRDKQTGLRYVLHVENKPLWGRFQPNEGENSILRAEHLKAKPQKPRFQLLGFDIVLITPQGIVDKLYAEASGFRVVILYEELALFMPEFGVAATRRKPYLRLSAGVR